MADDIFDQALAHYESAKDGWREINEKAVADQYFLSDEPYAQWDEREAQSRLSVNRPVVEIDQLSQFVHQVANDIRQNTPAIHVLPVGDDTDVETAEMIAGRIKAIEYKSNADAAYDMAADFAIRSSLGYIRVDHGYVSKKGFATSGGNAASSKFANTPLKRISNKPPPIPSSTSAQLK